ncbi:MAG: ribosome small subunit-dependent GTPase A [Myxococcales bacterium]|nr:ribosome small subunit-dependent GTPase A [Myxococcales bacterium]
MVSKQRKRRQTRTARSGRGSSWSANAQALSEQAGDDQAGELGTLVAHQGVAVEVRFDDPKQPQRMVRVRRRSGHVVGDRVEVVGERLRRLERRNELRRADALGKVHTVAANLDVLGIVVAPVPVAPAGFVDRALVSAAAAGIEPFLLVNKADLPGADETLAALRGIYEPLGLALFSVSAASGAGLEALRAYFSAGEDGRRGAFVGTSGVGKSSLLNALLPELELGVGEINEFSGLGRHTTTTATLHVLPDGGELIDTPGFRDFGLVDVTVVELTRFFPGFAAILQGQPCRFSDCRHLVEPDCAILSAVAEDRLGRDRWQRYHDLVAEVAAGVR